jgi:hypothetical protein
MSRVVNSDSSIDGTLYALEKLGEEHRAAFMRRHAKGYPMSYMSQWQDISRLEYLNLSEAANPYLTYTEHSRDWSYIIKFYDIYRQAALRAGNAKLLEDLAASADTMVQRRAGLPDEQQWRQIAELRRRKLNEREPA